MLCAESGQSFFRRVSQGAALLALAGLAWTGSADAKGKKDPDAKAERKAERKADAEAPTAVATKTNDATRLDGAAAEHPLVPAIKMAKQSRDALSKINGYSAVFTKREIVGNQFVQHSMFVKIRETTPFSVYLRFQRPHAGREVIYVEGRNGGNVLAHEKGLKSIVGTVSLAPTSADAMSESRYPITQIGLSKMLNALITQWEAELQHRDVDLKYYPGAKVGNVDCRMLESVHATPGPQFKFHMTRLYFDKGNLPVRVEQYGWPDKAGNPPPLVEEYTYTDIQTNLNLTDVDFDTRNPAYSY